MDTVCSIFTLCSWATNKAKEEKTDFEHEHVSLDLWNQLLRPLQNGGLHFRVMIIQITLKVGG